MRRALFALIVLLFLPLSTGEAQEARKAYFASLYDLDSDAVIYCVTTGQGGSPWGAAKPGAALIESSGSSTTWTAVTADTLPFRDLAAGDVIYAIPPAGGTIVTRLVTAKASGDSITVQTAADISAGSGYTFTFRTQTCGTAITNGWIDVAAYGDLTSVVQYDQGDLATSLDVRWECKVNTDNTAAVVVYPGEADACGASATLTSGYCAFTTAPANLAVVIAGRWDACRVGIKRTGNDTSDAGAALENVNITLIAGPRR